jgi:hypothetical protein
MPEVAFIKGFLSEPVGYPREIIPGEGPAPVTSASRGFAQRQFSAFLKIIFEPPGNLPPAFSSSWVNSPPGNF